MKSRRIFSAARLSLPFASALVALFSAHSAQGQTTRYWDGNNGTANFGSASGTWADPTIGTATAGWSTNAAGTTVVLGNSVTTLINDPLNFGTDTTSRGLGTGTITVSGTVAAASLRFGNQTTGNITLSGGTINLAAVTSIHVGAGSTTVHTISSNITGAATSLTKTGNTLRLDANNSYTGQTIISSGTLILNNSAVLGGDNPGVNGTSAISMGANSTLQSNYAPADAGITDSFVYAPITLTAAGTNNFFIGNGSSSAPAESVRYNLNGAIGGTAGANVVFGNTTAARNNADCIIVLGAASTYNGNTTIQAGNNQNRINVIAGVADAMSTTTVLGFDAVAGSGTGRTTQFNLNGNNQTLAGLENGGTVANLRNIRVTNTGSLANLTINNTADFTYGGTTLSGGSTTSAQITGAISLVKSGAGTFTLGGTLVGGATAQGNAFTGPTKILGGILVLEQTNSMQNSAFDTDGSILGDGANGLSSSVTFLRIGGLTGGNNFATRFTTAGGYSGLTGLVLNPGTGVTNSYSGDIADGATGMNLTKSGAGTQVLSGTNTYTGTTTGSVGVLFATQAASLPGYNVPGKVIFSGGTIAVQVGGGGWTALEVEALVTNATKNSGALGIDTTTGSLVQSTSFTAGTFGSTLGLNKLGVNDLTLDQASTYTGTTTVTAGTLTLADPLALQNSPLNLSGGSVVLSGLTTLTLGGLSGSGALDVTGLTNLTLNAPAGALLNYSGIIADGTLGMTVTKTGPGAQALTGANTYTGATQIDGGILTFGNKAAKTAATATAAAAGSIGLGVHTSDAAFYSATDVDALFNNNALTGFVLDPASGVAIDTTNAGGSFDQTVALTAARSLSKTGTGTLVLSQVNSHAGSTSVLQGTLSLTGSLTGGGAVSTSGAGVFSQSSTGVISGASTFIQGSTATSSLAGINTYAGVTNVNLGQLTISHADALGTTAGNTIVASGGRLAMATASLSVAEPLNITGTGSTATNGAIAFGGGVTGMALTGPITLGGAARIQADGNTGSTLSGGINLGANELTINADGGATQTIDTTAITGTGGSLVKSGSGTLVLGVANSYTGLTTLSAGTLLIGSIANIGAASPIGAGDNTSAASNTASLVFNGGTLAFTGTTGTTDRGFTMTGNGTISFPAGNNNELTFSGSLTGAGTLTLNGASTVGLQNVLTLSGSNADFTGNVTASIGGIKITNSTGLGSGTKTITLNNGSNGNSNIQLDGSGGDITLPSTFTYAVSNNNSGAIVNIAGNNTVAGQINNTSGGGGFKATSLGGNLTISANYTATTTLRNVILTGTSSGTFSGIISDGSTVNLPLQKTGTGTWTLSGVNTYTGATTVSDGTLAMGASDVLADSSAVSIGNATLDAATFTDTVGTLDVTSTASINLGTGAAIAFADSSAIDWTAGSLNITGTFVSGSSLRFGTTSSGLTLAQLAVISVNGAGAGIYTLNASGYLILPAGGYASWAAINASGSNPDQDKDGDGVNNAAEYVLGGTVTTNDLSKLPAASISGSNLLFTFNRSQASIDGSTVVTIEVGTTLLAWPDSYSVPGPAQANVPGVTIVKGTSVGFDTVTLSVPMGTDPKKFARLKTVVTP